LGLTEFFSQLLYMVRTKQEVVIDKAVGPVRKNPPLNAGLWAICSLKDFAEARQKIKHKR